MTAPHSSARIRGIPPVNPATGLSTDYLNHFSEAMMVLEMLPASPECLDEFLAWTPKSYAEHFTASGFSDARHVIAAYEAAAPDLRSSLDRLADIMNAMLFATREAMAAQGHGPQTSALAERTVQGLRPLIARVAAMINGTAPALYQDRVGPLASVEAVFGR